MNIDLLCNNRNKSVIRVVIVMIMLISLTGCNKANSKVPALDDLHFYSDEQLYEELKGFSYDDLHKAWGNPGKFGMGMPFDIWYLEQCFDDKNELYGDYITIHYNDGKVISATYTSVFYATVIEVNANHILVKPVEDEWELNSADKIIVYTDELTEDTKEQFKEGVMVKIGYDGRIMESYPAQIEMDFIEVYSE